MLLLHKIQTQLYATRSSPLKHSLDERQLIGVVYGFIIGFGCFVICQALKQARKANLFAVLIWSAIVSNFICATLVFLYLSEVIGPSLPLFVSLLILWAAELHLVLQIVVNRISLIWSSPRHIKLLRWGLFFWVCLIEISVFCIWLPARMGVSEKFVKINLIWDRFEKVLCLLTDGSLNATFILGVKKTLVANGLTKYDRLVKFNIKMMLLSLAMDLTLIGTMFMKNTFIYTLIHPLVAMVKLNVELEMSRLIVKVVRAQQGLKVIAQTQAQIEIAIQGDIQKEEKKEKHLSLAAWQIEEQELDESFGESTLSSFEQAHEWQPSLQINTHWCSIHRFRPEHVLSEPARSLCNSYHTCVSPCAKTKTTLQITENRGKVVQ